MSRLIAMVSMAAVVFISLQWLGENVIMGLLAEVGLAGQTGSVTGVIAFAVMGLMATVLCFKS